MTVLPKIVFWRSLRPPLEWANTTRQTYWTDVLLLPDEHRRIDIPAPGQHPRRAELAERRVELGNRQRHRRALFKHPTSLDRARKCPFGYGQRPPVGR